MDDGRPTASFRAIGAFIGSDEIRVLVAIGANERTQYPRAPTMDDPNAFEAFEPAFVEIFVEIEFGFFGPLPNQIEFQWNVFAATELVDLEAGKRDRFFGGRLRHFDEAIQPGFEAEPFAGDHLDLVALDLGDTARGLKRRDIDVITDFDGIMKMLFLSLFFEIVEFFLRRDDFMKFHVVPLDRT